MFKSDKKVGLIEQYKTELAVLQNKAVINNSNYWNRLTDYTNKFSADQLNYIDNNQQVIQNHSNMLNAFLMFMFDKHKDEFIALDNFRSICDTYINSVIEVGSEYENKVLSSINENGELKDKIKEYEKRIAELEGKNEFKTKRA